MIEASTTHEPAAGLDLAPFRQLFERLRRRARRWMQVETLAYLLLVVAVFFWVTLAVDWFFEPPVAVRALAVVAAAAAAAWIVAKKLVQRVRVPLEDRELAVLVERHHPEFADSLSTAVDRSGPPADRDLLARTVRSAMEKLPTIRPARLFREGRLARLLAAGFLGVATIAAAATAWPASADLWTRRMLLLRDDRWPRETSLEAIDFEQGVRIVARGSDVDVLARATRKIPEIVEMRVRSADGGRTERMGSRGGETKGGQLFGHVIEGAREDLRLSIRGGDARLDDLLLRVLDPPGLEKLEIAYTLPAYLGGGRRSTPASGIVQIPEGSAVEIVCVSTKPLSAATIVARPAVAVGGNRDETPPRTLASLANGNAGRVGGTSVTASIPSLEADLAIGVQLVDTDKLANLKPLTFRLVASPDEPPEVAVQLLGISSAVTPKARLPLIGTVGDDHGLAAAAMRIARAAPPTAAGAPVAAGEETSLPVPRLKPGTTLLELPESSPEIVPLEPLGLSPGGSITVSMSATDGCTLDGGPNVSSSDAWSLQVVTTDQLVAMLEARELVLRRRFENVVEEMKAAREALASASEPAPAAGRAGEATARVAGETSEIAEAFLLIRREFDNNALLTQELDTRLFAQIAAPLREIADAELPGLQAECRRAASASARSPAAVVARMDAVIQRMRAVLDRMMELETFNEVVELLRSAIRTQEEIRAETLKRQKERAKALLEEP